MGTEPLQNGDNKTPIGKEYWKQQAEKKAANNDNTWKAPDGSDNVPVGKSYAEVKEVNRKRAGEQQNAAFNNFIKKGAKTVAKVAAFALGGAFASCTGPSSATEGSYIITDKTIEFEKNKARSEFNTSEYTIKYDEKNKTFTINAKDIEIKLDETMISEIEKTVKKQKNKIKRSIEDLQQALETLKTKEAKVRVQDGLDTQEGILRKLNDIEHLFLNETSGSNKKFSIKEIKHALYFIGCDNIANFIDDKGEEFVNAKVELFLKQL